ncbi:ABC transporter substrate-binding protein [Bacillus salacetis]|uniref:ABC transporter substrate-binding protein n=1 Tax=Bacillus salacetis TaxID=2315464 RepID=A0A3A1R373_9BACI|nr:ABC transporter substrate-binding protein [Bacillus salacetis]RIW33252.1 ABC transporter substrate-binding protein [Bacillus salacetis]
MRKTLLFTLSLFLIFMGGCSQQEDASATDQKELEKMTIMLDWYPNAVHSYLYAAQEKGYFEDEGLDIEIKFPANPTDPINLSAAGKIDLGISYQPDVITARINEGIQVKSVAAIVRSPLNHVVFPEDSPIRSPKDLEGKKVGYPGIPLNEALLETMVKGDGGDPDKVKMIDVGFDLGSSIVSERTDAVIGAFINHEVPVLAHEGYQTRHFNPVEYGVPDFYELVLVTNDETWNEKEENIRAFWNAAARGYKFMKENPEEALQILMKNQDEANFPLIGEVEKASLEVLLPKMDSEDQEFGSQSSESWQETMDWLEETRLIEKKIEPEELFVDITG